MGSSFLVLLLKKSLLFSASLRSRYSFSNSSFREKAMLKSPRGEGGKVKSNRRAGDALRCPSSVGRCSSSCEGEECRVVLS